jgi:hypothetical protein
MDEDTVTLNADMSDLEVFHDAEEPTNPMHIDNPSRGTVLFQPDNSTCLATTKSEGNLSSQLKSLQEAKDVKILQKGRTVPINILRLGEGSRFTPIMGSGVILEEQAAESGHYIQLPHAHDSEWESLKQRAMKQKEVVDHGLRVTGSGKNPLVQTYDPHNSHSHGCYIPTAWQDFLNYKLPDGELKYVERPTAPFEWPLLTAFYGTAQDYYPVPKETRIMPNPLIDVVRLFGQEACSRSADVECPVPGCYWISSPANYDMHWNTAHTRYSTAFVCPAAVQGCSFVTFRSFKMDEHLLKEGSQFHHLERDAFDGNVAAEQKLLQMKQNNREDYDLAQLHSNYSGKLKDVKKTNAGHGMTTLRGRYLRVRIQNTNVMMPPGRPPVIDWHPNDACPTGTNIPELDRYVKENGSYAQPFSSPVDFTPANTLTAEGQFKKGIHAQLKLHENDILHCRPGERVIVRQVMKQFPAGTRDIRQSFPPINLVQPLLTRKYKTSKGSWSVTNKRTNSCRTTWLHAQQNLATLSQ